MILLAAAVLLSYYYMVYERRKRATIFGNIHLIEKTHGFKRFHISPWIALTKLVVVILLYLIATQSLQVYYIRPAENTAYMILLDSSASMSAADYEPSRIAAARQVAEEWTRLLPEDTLEGLIAYSDRIETHVPLTRDHEQVLEAIRQVRVNYTHIGTDVDAALRKAITDFQLRAANQSKVILLITDGTAAPDPLIISRLKELNIHVFAFGIGRENETQTSLIQEALRELEQENPGVNTTTYVSQALNMSLLTQLARETGGQAYRIENREELYQRLQEATLETVPVALSGTAYIVGLIILLLLSEFILAAKLGGL